MAAAGPHRPCAGTRPGSSDKAELAAAKRLIAEFETELAATRRAVELVREMCPQRRFEAVKVMAGEGIPVEVACRVLSVSVWATEAGISERMDAEMTFDGKC